VRNVALFFLVLFASAPARGQVEIDKPWIRATPPGAKVAAGYMLIRNKSQAPERLLSVSSPAAARVETHVTVKEGDISRMREVKGYEVPANGSFELKPGGAHLMFVDPKRPLKEGDKVPATLRFQRAGEVSVEFQVGAMGAGMQHMH
jgi:periplasmic copper chaperone A